MSWARWSIRKSRTRSWVMEDRLSQVVSDVTKVAEETKTAATSQGQKIVGPQGPLKHVVSQGSEESVPKISAEEMIKHWDRFSVVYGRDPRPEEECTGDQLTGVDTSLKRDIAPYVDFGIWVPDRHRLLKMLRNTGLQVHVGRVLRHIEISGPADFTSWSECLQPFNDCIGGIRCSWTRTDARLLPFDWKIRNKAYGTTLECLCKKQCRCDGPRTSTGRSV